MRFIWLSLWYECHFFFMKTSYYLMRKEMQESNDNNDNNDNVGFVNLFPHYTQYTVLVHHGSAKFFWKWQVLSQISFRVCYISDLISLQICTSDTERPCPLSHDDGSLRWVFCLWNLSLDCEFQVTMWSRVHYNLRYGKKTKTSWLMYFNSNTYVWGDFLKIDSQFQCNSNIIKLVKLSSMISA